MLRQEWPLVSMLIQVSWVKHTHGTHGRQRYTELWPKCPRRCTTHALTRHARTQATQDLHEIYRTRGWGDLRNLHINLCLDAAETGVAKCTPSLPAPEVGDTHSLAPARSCKGETQSSSGSTGHLLLPLLPCCEHISLNRAALNKHVELCRHGFCECLFGACGHG